MSEEQDTAILPEEAVVTVYDRAETSADWLVLRSAKAAAGDQWPWVCVHAAKYLGEGATFDEAFGGACRDLNVRPC